MQKDKVDETQGYTFGAFKGVFTPSILTILGVIMYLRFGWVLGQVGLPLTLLIVTMATAITLLTGLSLSATATNMHVGGGGAYYIISRSLGVEVGAAIGVPLFFAQSLGVAFYISGFAEAVAGTIDVAPWIARLPFAISEIRFISIITLMALTILAILSANLALKAQMLILTAIIVSLISFFLGTSPSDAATASTVDISTQLPFWAVFAVFFPAVTGIEAGLSMSGDLKDPAKALPRGTMAAVLVGYAVYMTIPIVLMRLVPDRTRLLNDPMVMQSVARWGALILLGVWAATLSSALGSLLGAPRTLQALSRDRIFPGILGRGYGSKNDPRLATAITFFVALVAILLGDLNLLAPVLSMFFLTSYGLLNLSTGLEGLIDSPSWRPRFRVRPALSLAGALGCFAVMLMINSGATFVAITAVGIIYVLQKRRKMKAQWGDMRYGILAMMAGYAIRRLALRKPDERTWRPNILVLSGAPQSRWHLIELAYGLARNASSLTVAAIVSGKQWTVDRIRSLRQSVIDYLQKRDVEALVKILAEDNFLDGAEALVKAYGFGPIKPNTILIGDSEEMENRERFASLMLQIYHMDRNLIVVRENDEQKRPASASPLYLDIWWSGQQTNIGLILTLAYLLKRSDRWVNAVVRLKRVIDDDADRASISKAISEHIQSQRLNVQVDFLPRNGLDIFELIQTASQDAALVFLGLRAPAPDETPGAYAEYFARLRDRTDNLSIAYVLACDKINFEKIVGIG